MKILGYIFLFDLFSSVLSVNLSIVLWLTRLSEITLIMWFITPADILFDFCYRLEEFLEGIIVQMAEIRRKPLT